MNHHFYLSSIKSEIFFQWMIYIIMLQAEIITKRTRVRRNECLIVIQMPGFKKNTKYIL